MQIERVFITHPILADLDCTSEKDTAVFDTAEAAYKYKEELESCSNHMCFRVTMKPLIQSKDVFRKVCGSIKELIARKSLSKFFKK